MTNLADRIDEYLKSGYHLYSEAEPLLIEAAKELRIKQHWTPKMEFKGWKPKPRPSDFIPVG